MIQLWNQGPWRFGKEIQTLQREMDRMFEEFSQRFPRLTSNRDVDFVPACDIEETDDNYLISVDVPGMKKEDLKVEFANQILTVSGEHKEEKKQGKKNQRVTERYEGVFERSFHLPDGGDSKKVEANYADGVLRISVPKAAQAQTRQIPIGEAKPTPKLTTKEQSSQKHSEEGQKSAAA